MPVYVDVATVMKALDCLLSNLDPPSSTSVERILEAATAVRPTGPYVLPTTRGEWAMVLAPVEAWARAHQSAKRARAELSDGGEEANESSELQDATRQIDGYRYKRANSRRAPP